jgi:glycerol kinase
MANLLLAIDQGTTSTRVMIFNEIGQAVSQYQVELKQYFPDSGWVEHDPEEIWQTTLTCCQQAVDQSNLVFNDILAIGITNQRETTIIWDRATGEVIHKAIVWQDRRTSDLCQHLHNAGHEALVQSKTGLLLDPYFSASKISWLLDTIPKARQRAEKGELAFGTIDTFLLWRLTKGASHFTDATNASRTLLYNIHTQQWDNELLKLFRIPASLLPEVLDNTGNFGLTHSSLFGHEIPILAMAGDQQAALVGQACLRPGMIKSTYGTGTFLILNTGEQVVTSKNRLLTTIAYRLHGKVTYGIEGSTFSAGSIIQWLRDKLKLLKDARESEDLAAGLPDNGGVHLIPAFTGLGAPYWQPNARASIAGITRDTDLAHIVRAGLEAVAYQTRDLLDAMIADGATALTEIRVDGGMVVNNWLMQFLADILQLPVERPVINETTALGVAYLAGLQAGMFSSLEQIGTLWQFNKRFEPKMEGAMADGLYRDWQSAVKKAL